MILNQNVLNESDLNKNRDFDFTIKILSNSEYVYNLKYNSSEGYYLIYTRFKSYESLFNIKNMTIGRKY